MAAYHGHMSANVTAAIVYSVRTARIFPFPRLSALATPIQSVAPAIHSRSSCQHIRETGALPDCGLRYATLSSGDFLSACPVPTLPIPDQPSLPASQVNPPAFRS